VLVWRVDVVVIELVLVLLLVLAVARQEGLQGHL
jgi:hypothetical protein